MSLDWNATKVANLDALHSNELEKSKTVNLCWLLMAVGVGRITEENVADVFTRISLWEGTRGAVLSGLDQATNTVKRYPYTLADIKARVGYSTNVSSETKTQWLKRFYTNLLEDNQRSLNNGGK